MPSRSSSHSTQTTLSSSGKSSRSETPRQSTWGDEPGRAGARSDMPRSTRSPKDKDSKSMAEVQRSGRQSDQGGRPGASGRRGASRGR